MRQSILVSIFLFTALGAFAQKRIRGDNNGGVVVPVCKYTVVYQGGIADNFGGGPDPVAFSPMLAAYAHSQSQSPKPYDDPTCDRWFADSLKVSGCAICESLCAAELEITITGCGQSDDCNDQITVGQAPWAVGTPGRLLNEYLYPQPCPDPPAGDHGSSTTVMKRASLLGSPIVKSYPIDINKLKQLCYKAQGGPLWIDVLVQDDTIVDSMRLTLHYN